ncbi:conserved protein of unknown function [Tenacibaculum sp. 190130A14a]|uniref:Uncharacterized protein n=1 Tax=Tenacibaculum polynesiense TaxID=3137857 RepID=A0ABM9P8N7_9FLAO
MKQNKKFLESPLYFEYPISCEVMIDEDNKVRNKPFSATEFVFYNGEFEFQKDWVKKAYKDDLIDFIQLESKDSKDFICNKLIMRSELSLDNLLELKN